MHEHPGWSGGVALSAAVREAMLMVSPVGLVELIATAGLTTDAPDEGSGPIRSRSGPFAAHEWEPCQVLAHPWGRGRRFVALSGRDRGCPGIDGDLGRSW